MGSNHDSSQHEVEGDGHYPAMKMQGSKPNIFTEWFREYTAANGDDLTFNSDIVKAVDSDELDAKFVERRIKESAPDAPILKGFCAKCQSLFHHWPTVIGDSSTREHGSKPNFAEGWDHTVARWSCCSTFELESSTRSGCRFCAFLLQSLKDGDSLDTYRKIEARLYDFDENASLSLSVQNCGINPMQLLWLNLPGKVCTDCNSGVAVNIAILSSFLPESADCYDELPDVFNIANNWVSKCTENHDLCKSNGDSTLPTRLIYITGESPRLDLDTYMEALPVERLPKTFKDAIEITQRLGLDYLWIDSLCIIQDSVEDWQKESALMSSVFGGSTINIAACSARDGRQGCFTKQPYFSGGLRTRITDGKLRRVQDFHSGQVYDLSTFETHLGTRAWALQEKMLPPRTIHFGDRGAFWECRSTIASEYLPDGFPRKLGRDLVRRNRKLQKHWLDIVRLYSAANLTFGKDKLPALSGIARLGHNETGDLYLAGLWRDKLEEQLCWSRSISQPSMMRLRPPMRPRPPWRAPTWSWASIDGEVTWHGRHKGVLDTTYVQVLDAYATKHGYDPFGQVTSGVIRLACSTMAAGYLVYPSESNYPEPEADATIVLYAGDRELNFSVRIDCQDDNNTSSGKLCYLLPIFSGKTGTGTRRRYELMIDGIVLQATGITKGEFCRIGSFKFYKNRSEYSVGDKEESYERFLLVLKSHGKATAKAACKEVTSNRKHIDKRYVITLV
ncbi:hypothetical protein VF21_00677 [Pseudogymnoascus sp. 05NY08]|nr:hypothetical protein VF21_00677 [Pseudogymnoascus sp. 05NY08]